jgi:hypothetical protein
LGIGRQRERTWATLALSTILWWITVGVIEHYEQHPAIVREIGDRRGEGNALFNLSLMRLSWGSGNEPSPKLKKTWRYSSRSKIHGSTEYAGDWKSGARKPEGRALPEITG